MNDVARPVYTTTLCRLFHSLTIQLCYFGKLGSDGPRRPERLSKHACVCLRPLRPFRRTIMTLLLSLSEDILVYIFSLLDVTDLVLCSQASRPSTRPARSS